MTRCALMLLAGLLVAGGAGCQPYALRGKVIEGPESTVSVVSANNERFAGVGVPGATVQVTLDPQSLGRKQIGSVTTDADGSFSLPVNETGAGVLEYQIMVVGRARGFDSANELLMLPGADKRLLITLERGRDTYRPERDPIEEAEPYLKEMRR